MEPSRTAPRQRARRGLGRRSQAGWVVQENPGNVERGAEMLRERAHAECLRGVVTAVIDVHTQLLAIEERVMGALTGNERVESLSSGLSDKGSAGSCNDAHPPDLCRTEFHSHRRSTEGFGQTLREGEPFASHFAPDPDRLLLPHSKLPSHRDSERARQQHGVPDLLMTIQGEVGPVHGDPRPDYSGDPVKSRADQRSDPTPEYAMVNEEKVGPLFGGHAYGRGTKIDGSSDASYRSLVCDLQAVQRLRVITNGVDSQVLIAILNEFLELHIPVGFRWFLRLNSIKTISRHHLYILNPSGIGRTRSNAYVTRRSVIHTEA